ncbi:Fat storage-inducing transmembrane protein, partial [Penicillium coprophilum]|uniref:Fat storage-inducing transmembrane protein n=1 Tax=Penicillium coprophilum TaxID=36646 RepID=UPI00239E4CE5
IDHLLRESRLMLTTMATSAARPPTLLSAVLLIYPATLLLGSLFSTISPTARHSRDPFSSSSPPASPLAPSLAADLHLSEGPVNYFARKNNIFNVYFVKIGWLWTTAAFVSLLIFQPSYSSSRRESSAQQEARFRRILQAILRYALITTVWYLATQWFFGPAIIDRGFVATGGKCERALDEAGKMAAGQSSSTNLETLFTAATCKTAGGAWRGGHDISGHVLMLVLATGFLAFEAVGASAPACLSRFSSAGDVGRERKASDADNTPVADSTETGGFAETWSLRLVWGVVGLGWWMLFMTAIWFHTWLEKWSGLLIALSAVYAIYILPRRIAPLRDVIGLPGV